MGYDLDRFLENPDQELICSICQMVYENPLVTPCGHTFCGACIKEWLSKKGFCPLDKTAMRQSDLRRIPISFRNMIGTSLKIRCDHRKEGCMVISKLDDLEDHENSCPFRRRRPHNPSSQRRTRSQEGSQSQESDQNRFIQTVVTVFGVIVILAAAVIFRR